MSLSGSPPKKKGARARQLADLARERRTVVFYESPRRILALVEELKAALGDRRAVLGREMTKHHEEFIRGRLSDIESALAQRSAFGENAPSWWQEPTKPPGPRPRKTWPFEIRQALARESVRHSELARTLAARLGLARKTVYDMILEIQKESRG